VSIFEKSVLSIFQFYIYFNLLHVNPKLNIFISDIIKNIYESNKTHTNINIGPNLHILKCKD